MKYALILLSVLGLASPALAGNEHLCCDLPVGAPYGACTAAADGCAQSVPYGVDLWQLTGSDAGVRPGTTDVTFPDGIDGYLRWSSSPPWVGFCLDEQGAADPSGCLSVSLVPGVGAAGATWRAPADPKWEGFRMCFGPPVGGSCANVDDLNDPTVQLTPSGSCCGPALLFSQQLPGGPQNGEWVEEIGQEIPAVPPPILVYVLPDASARLGIDGGTIVADESDYLKPDDQKDDGYEPVPDMCLPEFLETPTCGQQPVGGTPAPSFSDGSVAEVGTDDAGAPDAGSRAAIIADAAMSSGCSAGGHSGSAWALLALGLSISVARRLR
jgi:hypothetical protein